MTTKANANIRVVTIIDLWYIFVHRLWVMALAAVVAVGGLFIINQLDVHMERPECPRKLAGR